MKFSIARGALTLAVALTLASCGGGGKATFPITVTVTGQQYGGLVLSTNGQDLTVPLPANPSATTSVTVTFPQAIEYGQTYSVAPKTQPLHQSCSVPVAYPNNLLPYGTAGQLKEIKIYYTCTLNGIPLGGKVNNLKGTGLVLANGSEGGTTAVPPLVDSAGAPTGAQTSFAMLPIPFERTYGVTVLTQPKDQTCTVANGVGTMTEAAEKDPEGVHDLVVTCTDNPTP